MKSEIIILIVIFLASCSETHKKERNQNDTTTINIEGTLSDIPVSNECIDYDLQSRLRKIREYRLITFGEKDLKVGLDSIKSDSNVILNVFLDSINNVETFHLLSQLQNQVGICLNLDISRNNRDGFNLLNNFEYLEVSGATEYHINQLKDLKNLKMLHLKWANIDSFPRIFNGDLKLNYLNFTLCTINNIPKSFTNQPCLEELEITKTIIGDLPLDNNLSRLKKITTYRAMGLKLSDNLDSLKSLEVICLDQGFINKQIDFKLLNFEKSTSSNYESIVFKRK